MLSRCLYRPTISCRTVELTMVVRILPKMHYSVASVTKGAKGEDSTTDSESETNNYRAIVVGAGPAGIASVGNLLDGGVSPILWLDEKFEGGRLNGKYRQVPSNTKVSLFLKFSEACEAFRKIIDSSSPSSAYSALKELDQNKGCQLKYAADLCLQLTDGFRSSPDVRMSLNDVKSAYQNQSGDWSIITEASKTRTVNSTPLLVMCTGSSPKPPTLPTVYKNVVPIDLDIALNPPELSKTVIKDGPQTVAVIGASHSAILILRNLYEIASSTHPKLKIFWFTRHSLRYAQDMGDWILRDNTGLKGEAAEWAKANLEDDTFSEVSQFIKKINTKNDETEQYNKFLTQCDHVVEAIGFNTDPLPTLIKINDGKQTIMEDMACDHTTGGFVGKDGVQIKGLYGAGIAFPERVTDPYGNTEMAVGMWKFMRYMKKVVPLWIENTVKKD